MPTKPITIAYVLINTAAITAQDGYRLERNRDASGCTSRTIIAARADGATIQASWRMISTTINPEAMPTRIVTARGRPGRPGCDVGDAVTTASQPCRSVTIMVA
jgi:hypothetical protein